MNNKEKFIKATEGQKNTVIYITKEGQRYQYSGGTRTWRNQNPGNMVVGAYSKKNGMIGKAGGFAVFPSYEIGHAAQLDLLKNRYGKSTMEDMIKAYAPEGENNTTAYLRFLLKSIGIKNSKAKVIELTDLQFEKLWKAIEKMEGWEVGKIQVLPPLRQITKVMKNKKQTIVAYFVRGLGWIDKEKGIEMTHNGLLDAVVATSRAGNFFLRTRPDVKIENNLSLLD